jgi:hypothetical protein
MLKIKIPNVCEIEQRYLLDVLLGDFLGLTFEVEIYEGDVIKIMRSSNLNNDYKITLDASFFHKAQQDWLNPKSMPVLPLQTWIPEDDGIQANLVTPVIPIIYGSPGLVKNGKHIHLNLDIFGSIFFMLSRYEEVITKDRDKHDRFPSWASVAYKANFLDRPIVNEYLEILWDCLSTLWTDLKRKKRQANNLITCDVDLPFDPALYSLKLSIKKTLKLLIKDKRPISAFKVVLFYLAFKIGLEIKDVYREAISWIMDVNESVGNSVNFYFIVQNTSRLDTTENFDSYKMRSLFLEIYNRGHKIGLHPGYETYNNIVNFKKTVDKFKRILKEENIEQREIGGRQHFLRWDSSKTIDLWERNSLDYDSTLSFADKAGFRCGVCYEYAMYDLVKRKSLRLKQKPLIVMESTIISPQYEALGYSLKALDRFNYFKKVSHQFNGTFNLLWHNSHMNFAEDKKFYKELIK